MARTRSQASGPSALINNSGNTGNSSDDPDDSLSSHEPHFDAIQLYLRKAQKSTKLLHKCLEKSYRENEKLKRQLEVQKEISEQSTQSGRRFKSTQADAKRIKQLEAKVKKLKDLNNRQRIEKEVREEAEDLEQNTEDVVCDRAHHMRKLLRRFNDLMLVVTLGEKETCPVCFEILQLKKCSSLTCEHLLCNDCLPKISRGADETLHCPMCRQSCARSEVMLVHMSETMRWDTLLEVAQASSAILREGEETEEEEEEENFINDSDSGTEVETRSTPQGSAQDDSVEAPEPSTDASMRGTSAPDFSRSYSSSPRRDKRKMLEKLVEDRLNNKKSRR